MGTPAEWHNHIHAALKSAKAKHAHVFIIGGGDIFKQCSKYINVFLVTQVRVSKIPTKIDEQKSITTFEPNAFAGNRIWHSPIMEQNGLQFHFEMWKTRKIQKHSTQVPGILYLYPDLISAPSAMELLVYGKFF